MTKLTHLDEDGCVNMVDVGSKDVTLRCAVATGKVRSQSATLQFPKERRAPKGAVITTAGIAGIMAAKRTHELIPLCHPLSLTRLALPIMLDEDLPGFRLDVTSGGKSGDWTAGEPAR
ncbi:MAG: cyclic pyranopterin monophosphate synthase MoaC [Parvibaculum sp.]|uniref:cyclic pyranopterin monophosphate synthase MoaC n=1 Tax=Parvibaculum sp. TaxID=2024848 RepID=UPI00271F9F3B|nr:cyclic pyranopterin monophosphate synthase MoaC [Parvibaculum sp.]MDO8838421.1 cyclic pyranopterin monophosphate synthase MoaC [Parvibaculum sp.]